jgi:hypothetical protein
VDRRSSKGENGGMSIIKVYYIHIYICMNETHQILLNRRGEMRVVKK